MSACIRLHDDARTVNRESNALSAAEDSEGLFNDSQRPAMISFASFPAAPHVPDYSQPHHPYSVPGDAEMDLDEDELDADGSNLTCPGETLTSSQAFMR